MRGLRHRPPGHRRARRSTSPSAASSPASCRPRTPATPIVVEHGLEATARRRPGHRARVRRHRRRARGRARRPARRARARGLGAEHLQRLVRAREAGLLDGRQCTTHWMYTDEMSRTVPAGPASTPPSSTSTTSTGHHQRGHGRRHRRVPAPGPPRARRRRRVGRSPAGWSCPRTATAARRSTSTPRCRATPTRWPRCSPGWSRTSRRSSACPTWPPARSSPSGRSPAGSAPRPGTTPAAWVTRQRVVRAQEMLERSDASIEEIARLCGFGTAAVLRHHFARTLGTSPQAYRRTFAPRTGRR